jgi:hypothetical protein
MLLLVSFHERGQNLEAISFRRTFFCAPEPFDITQRVFVIGIVRIGLICILNRPHVNPVVIRLCSIHLMNRM